MSRLEEFLQTNVEGYLFYDLRTMENDDANGEGVAYPILMSTCAGIELLGALMSGTPFKPFNLGRQFFGEYWRQTLYPAPSPYSTFGDATYQLVRHGIAHAFLLKGVIGVLRKDASRHFVRDAQGFLVIDAVQLARDFVTSYETRVKPLLAAGAGGGTGATGMRGRMEQQLTEMEREYQGQALLHGSAFTAAPISSVTGSTTESVTPSGVQVPPLGSPKSGP
jgi:hypothetical protein